jgi:hypothetical protein
MSRVGFIGPPNYLIHYRLATDEKKQPTLRGVGPMEPERQLVGFILN